jgi:putative tricarboxylic transport membrane protein
MIIHGVNPGPLIMVENPKFVYDVVAMMMYATLGIFVFGLLLVRPLIKVLQVPRDIIMPIVFVLCVIGSFAISQRLFDIWTMLGFGAVGYILRRFNYPMAPFVLGIVLGDLLDKNLRRGLVLSDGDLTPFFTRPISMVLLGITVLAILMNITAVHQAVGRAGAAIKARMGFAR